MTIKIKDKLDNTPHLMTEQSLVNFINFVENPPTREYLSSLFDEEDDMLPSNYDPETRIATLPVFGSLEYRTEWYHYYGWGTSYEMLIEKAQQFADAGAEIFFMPVDSGGGEAYACFETANQIKKIAKDNNIKIIAYVDGYAASGGYGIPCVADEVIANPMSEVGSIGVVIRLRNINKAMKEAGIEDTYIYAGKNKIAFNKDGTWQEDFLNDMQKKVDATYEEFTNHVASNRGIDVETVKSTEAAVFIAKDALELGLIDSVMTHEEFSTYLADYVQNKKETQMFNKMKIKLNSEQEKVKMKELEETQLELSAAQTKLSEEVAAKAALESKLAEVSATLETLQAKVASYEELAEKLEVEKQAAAKAEKEAKLESRKAALSAVLPADQVEEKFLALAEASDEIFNIAVGGYKAAEEAKKQTALFQEQGGQGEVVDHGNPVDQKTSFLEWQKNKYKKN